MNRKKLFKNQKENFCVDIGSVEPIAPKLAIYHFIFLLVVSLLCIGVLPGVLLLHFEKAEAMSAETKRKGLQFLNKLKLINLFSFNCSTSCRAATSK